MPFAIQNITGHNQLNNVAGDLNQFGNTFYNDSRNSCFNTASTTGPETRMYYIFRRSLDYYLTSLIETTPTATSSGKQYNAVMRNFNSKGLDVWTWEIGTDLDAI